MAGAARPSRSGASGKPAVRVRVGLAQSFQKASSGTKGARRFCTDQAWAPSGSTTLVQWTSPLRSLAATSDREARASKVYSPRMICSLRERAQSGVEVDVLEEMTGLTIRTLGAVTLGRNAARVDELTYNDLQAAFELAGRAGGPMDAETRARQRQLTGQLKGFADTLIDTARKAEPPDGSLLSVLAHTRIEATGACLDTPSIRDEVLTIMFAGHETTALTLTWMFKLIQNHPDIRAQMQQEIQNVLQGRTPALDDLPKLVTVRNVINETLRQRPAVPITARAVGEKAVIGGIALEPGDAVLPFIWGTHHHSGFWKRPDGFEPSRFSPERSAGRNKWSFIPFTAGSRICVGQELARTELTVHTALLMQAVDMQVADEVVTPRATLTLRPDVPVRAHVRARALGPSTGASQ